MEDIQMLPTPDEQEDIEDESSLVEAAKVDLAAFETLYQRYVTRVYRYLFLRSNRDEDAADLTQQVFLKVLDSLPNYRSRGIPFAAWLFRIARHVAMDTYRRHKGTVSWDLVPDDSQRNGELNPETIILHQERLTQLRRLIADLDPYKRELLALRFSANLSTTEIADVVGKSRASVKKQLTRTLHTLKGGLHEG